MKDSIHEQCCGDQQLQDGPDFVACLNCGEVFDDLKALVKPLPPPILANVIAFARETWLNDGAEGETVHKLCDEAERMSALLNSPELHDFAKAVALEAAHQRQRWGTEHDAGKTPADWFWLLGYLGGKALAAHIAGNTDKALHHTISSAAALANWHAAISGADKSMRPGIETPAQEQQP